MAGFQSNGGGNGDDDSDSGATMVSADGSAKNAVDADDVEVHNGPQWF